MKIVLFDPSLRNSIGEPSTNLGDLIIYNAVKSFLNENFKNADVIRISTHEAIDHKNRDLIKKSDLCFVGGTNLLSSNLKEYNQWKSNIRKRIFDLPTVNNAVLLGVGWWQYQDTPSKWTASFYRKLLSNQFMHSVRDSYTSSKLSEINISNNINTSCPTTWELEGFVPDIKDKTISDVLLMLTDYHPDLKKDNDLIELLIRKFSGKIYFFPQGSNDLSYFESLELFRNNKDRFVVMRHDIDDLNDFVDSNSNFVYVGTRLHGGIRCLQKRRPAIILANDNRSIEIGKDINLAVIKRGDNGTLSNWIEGDSDFGAIRLPMNKIILWKNQFK